MLCFFYSRLLSSDPFSNENVCWRSLQYRFQASFIIGKELYIVYTCWQPVCDEQDIKSERTEAENALTSIRRLMDHFNYLLICRFVCKCTFCSRFQEEDESNQGKSLTKHWITSVVLCASGWNIVPTDSLVYFQFMEHNKNICFKEQFPLNTCGHWMLFMSVFKCRN